MANDQAKNDDGLVTPGEADPLAIVIRDGEKPGRTLARSTLDPNARNAALALTFGSAMFSDRMKPNVAHGSAILESEMERTAKGDLTLASRMLTAQAVSLDTLFTEMARRSGANMGQYPAAAESYMRLALKAQTACRGTLEALARLHQPREQTVRHVHVNEGGQAVIADQFHHHTGGQEFGKPVK
ncbi:MAG: hypothetical protein INF18_08550 [Methylobacterium sp.]|jgi:hypothetical protein|nr:hypothetical protein [Methylobacterium sp.]MCA3640092.1 hypothetical protein [Methylobacterium sp.]